MLSEEDGRRFGLVLVMVVTGRQSFYQKTQNLLRRNIRHPSCYLYCELWVKEGWETMISSAASPEAGAVETLKGLRRDVSNANH